MVVYNADMLYNWYLHYHKDQQYYIRHDTKNINIMKIRVRKRFLSNPKDQTEHELNFNQTNNCSFF